MKSQTKIDIEFECRLSSNAKNWNSSHVSYGLETGTCFESDDEGVIFTSSETFLHVFNLSSGLSFVPLVYLIIVVIKVITH